MKKSIYFLKKLTAAEVGLKGTHEVYVRLPNDFDYESFFPSMAKENGTVLQVDFFATNSTVGHNKDQQIPLKFVFYANSNKEKRLPSLGDFFSSNDVQEGDVVCLESRQENDKTSFYITFTKAYLATLNPVAVTYSIVQEDSSINTLNDSIKHSLQQIFYGAPGTGKSHSINDETKDDDVLRTTFHPDTDYASFVGAYKPTTIDEQVMAVIGTQAVPMTNKDGSPRTESKIVYEFVAQSFLNAYTQAWEKQAEAADGEVKKQYLVIEEINRGNCAQIFGDLFQLLDRNENGFSEYPITADADMKRQLQKAFNGLEVTNKDSINKDFEGRDVVSEVLNGDVLLLPNNFYIWATMNTSDQSLFPIDSAFKRRWDWQYIPISNANKGWMIEAGGKKYDWWQYLSAINAKIGSTTSSEDKKLGYFFCKANGECVITADRFVGKVIFYIWNDVFKDYELGDAIFNDPEGGKLTFDKFYTSEGKNSMVVEDKVVAFLSNLGVKPMEDGGAEPLSDETIADTVFIKVNGQQVDKYNAIGYTAVEKYVDMNSDKTAEEIANIWGKFVSCNPTKWFIVDEAGRKELSERYQSYSYEIKCSDNKSVWVNKDGWRRATINNSRDTVQEFIDAVNAENLSVHIEEIKQ